MHKNEINHVVTDSVTGIATKSGVGFMGALTAMTINEIAGLVVAVLTAIYMLFQIEAAWARRKDRKNKNES